MKARRGLLSAVLVLLTGVVTARKTNAAELRVSGVLVKTYMVSSDVGIFFSPSFAPAFASVPVECPQTPKCTLRIELDTQVNGLNPSESNVIVALVTVDGSTQSVLPNALLG